MWLRPSLRRSSVFSADTVRRSVMQCPPRRGGPVRKCQVGRSVPPVSDGSRGRQPRVREGIPLIPFAFDLGSRGERMQSGIARVDPGLRAAGAQPFPTGFLERRSRLRVTGRLPHEATILRRQPDTNARLFQDSGRLQPKSRFLQPTLRRRASRPNKKPCLSGALTEALCRTRTDDPLLTMEVSGRHARTCAITRDTVLP
jgi:hypothetical protein